MKRFVERFAWIAAGVVCTTWMAVAAVGLVAIAVKSLRDVRRQNDAERQHEAERQTSAHRACHARCDDAAHIAKWTDDEGCLCFPVERLGSP